MPTAIFPGVTAIGGFVAMFSKKKHLACILIGYVLLVFLPLILLFFR